MYTPLSTTTLLFLFLNCLIAYIMGSIPSGVWIGQYFYKKDIRQYGSGNTGTTNTFRVLGKKAGSIVFLMDSMKGAVPVVIAQHLLPIPPVSPLFVGLFAIIGHTFPLFAQFKGGKAVATLAGVMLAYQPLLVLWCIPLFAGLLVLTRMVSLSSMITITAGVLLSFFFNDPLLTGVALLLDVFIIYRHRTNIVRIKNKTENKVPMPWDKPTS